MPPINVLHVLDKLTVGDSHLHGVTRLCAWWIPAYDRSGFRVVTASLRARDAAGEYLERVGADMRYLNSSSFDPRALPALIALAREEHIQVLHLHGYGATNFGRLCAAWLGIPCIVHEHIVDSGMPAVQKVADRLLSRFATVGIAISEATKDFMAGPRALPRDRIEVIYNGIPLDAYRDDAATPSAWKREAGIPEHHRCVAIVGRLNEIKGHRFFLEAAASVLEHIDDVSFVVVGDGELMQPLKAQADSLGIARRVFFLGHRDDVPDILRDSEISVISSLSEGGPLVLFEAMAARCATLITDTCGLAELVDEGRNGFVIPARDADAIAARVTLLLEDAELAKSIGERARDDAFGYDVDSTVAKFQAIYRRLVQS